LSGWPHLDFVTILIFLSKQNVIANITFSLLFFTWFWTLLSYLLFCLVCSNLLNLLNSLYAPSFVWASLIINDFFFVYFSYLPPVWGVILVGVNFLKKNALGSKRDCKRFFFSLVKGLSKMTFFHFKHMYLGLVSFVFFNVIMRNGFSLFILLKLSFKVVSWYCYSSGFFGIWSPF